MAENSLHESTQQYISSVQIASGYDKYFTHEQLFDYDSQVLYRWFNRPGRMLDLGCGTGRHVALFARLGFDMVGVDLSRDMLYQTQRKLKEARLDAKLVLADFCDLPINDHKLMLQTSFDYAICMFSTLGLIYGNENRIKFLKDIWRLLVSKGQLALHVHNKGYNIWRHEGRAFLRRNRREARLGNEEPGDKYMENYRGIENMYLHVFTEDEICKLLNFCGFKVLDVIALNRKRNGPLKNNFMRSVRSNGFLVRTEKV